MTRRLLNLLTALLALLSLLVCVGSAILWVRGGRVGDVFSWSSYWQTGSAGAVGEGPMWRGVGIGLTSGRGGVSFSGWHTVKAEPPDRLQKFRWSTRLNPAYGGTLPGRSPWGSGAVAAWTAPVTGPAGVEGRTWEVTVPLWPVVVLAAAPPLLWAARFARRRRARARLAEGQCPRCGYDLTGNVSGVCPECGECGGAGSGRRP